MIPLAIYGLSIAAIGMKSDISDYQKTDFIEPTTITANTSMVCSINIGSTAVKIQGLLRFAMALFDISTAIITFTCLYKRKKVAQTWLTTILTRDQLIYVGATTLTYIALGIELLIDSKSRVSYLGVAAPSIM
jgi:hypothetical protein